MLNSRGQDINEVNKSVEKNKPLEKKFQDFINEKYKIEILEEKDRYNPYDFSYNKVHKIEYKGLYYVLNDVNKTAYKAEKKTTIHNVFISKSKIDFFKQKQRLNPSLKFYIFYGFYEINDINNEMTKIEYRFINITDLNQSFFKDIHIHMKAEHYKIPIKDLLRLPDELLFNNL